jgi:hypothetical protein
MIDTAVLQVRADAAMRARRYTDALVHLRKLIQAVDRIDFEYEEWLRLMAECLRAQGLERASGACLAYLGATEVPSPARLEALGQAARGGDVEALRGLRSLGIYLGRAGHHLASAAAFAAADMPVHRVIAFERAGEDARAAGLWAALIESDALSSRPYELALAKINHGLCLLRIGHARARTALAEATTAVEEVADRFETDGLRERAFDCYQLLARLGIEAGAFENVAEGYLNSVRILKDDALKLDALRLYEAFITLARRAGEHHAVAGILRDAADYCTRSGLPYADDLRMRSGEAWLKAAQEAATAGHPPQIVENAHVAAAEAFASVRAFKQVAEVYRALVASEHLGRGRERYRRLLERLGPKPEDAPRPIPVPEFLKQMPEYEEVWYVDLAEWELDGDPLLLSAGVMADRRFPDFVRRHALLLVLELERTRGVLPVIDVVRRLQSIRAYPVTAALERLYATGDGAVKREVARAMGSLRFKRSFGLLAEALRSGEPGVRVEAREAIKGLFFPHAFDRLRAIYESRDLPDAEATRVAALKAIGRINTVEALDFLCDRLREGEQPYAEHAAIAIGELSNADLMPYLKQQIELVPALYRSRLEDAVQRLAQRGR